MTRLDSTRRVDTTNQYNDGISRYIREYVVQLLLSFAFAFECVLVRVEHSWILLLTILRFRKFVNLQQHKKAEESIKQNSLSLTYSVSIVLVWLMV